MKLRSQVIQKDLPRPTDVNNAVMRPTPGINDPPLSLLQKVTFDIKLSRYLLLCIKMPKMNII